MAEEAKPVRVRRVKQFVREKSYVYDTGLSMDLLNSASLLMRTAATDPAHVPAAILATVAAFEVWINGLIVGRFRLNDEGTQDMLAKSTIAKVDFLVGLLD